MIKSNFDDLRRKKALNESRDISLRKVSEETGLAFNTLQRLRKGETERVALSTLDRLCSYFQLSSLCDLIEYLPIDITTAREEVDKHEGKSSRTTELVKNIGNVSPQKENKKILTPKLRNE